MDDSELISTFIKTTEEKSGHQLSVCQIDWDGPHTPQAHWTYINTFPQDTPEETIQRAIQKLLHNPRYFRVCIECLERKPDGWMSGDLCHHCMEQNHGVVF